PHRRCHSLVPTCPGTHPAGARAPLSGKAPRRIGIIATPKKFYTLSILLLVKRLSGNASTRDSCCEISLPYLSGRKGHQRPAPPRVEHADHKVRSRPGGNAGERS